MMKIDSLTRQGFQDITYYRLKHTTVHKNSSSDLKLKIIGRQVRPKGKGVFDGEIL